MRPTISLILLHSFASWSLILTFNWADGPNLLQSFHKILPILLVRFSTFIERIFIIWIFISYDLYYYRENPIILSRLFDFLNKHLISHWVRVEKFYLLMATLITWTVMRPMKQLLRCDKNTTNYHYTVLPHWTCQGNYWCQC